MSWYSDLCRYALYWLPDMQDAEEVVLDFFMHLWLHRATVNISSSFKGYALMSVRNRCISRLRGSRVTVSIDELDPLSCLYEQDGMSVEDASRIVWEAVSTLPAKSREIFRKKQERGYDECRYRRQHGHFSQDSGGAYHEIPQSHQSGIEKVFHFHFFLVLGENPGQLPLKGGAAGVGATGFRRNN